MYILVVHMEVQPDKLEAFKAVVSANVRASLNEPGLVRFDFIQQKDAPAKFMFYEVYRSAEAYEEHKQSEHFKRWIEQGVPLLAGERVRTFYENVEPDDRDWR